MTERLIDRLITDSGKVFDEQMVPLIIEDLKAQFQDAKREGRKQTIALEKEKIEALINFESMDIDAILDIELTKDAVQAKLEKCNALYKELFGEDLA